MKVLLLAGEESGVMYAEQIRARLVGCEVRGYGDYGFKTSDLAVMGIGQVLKRIFFFLRVKRTMIRALDDWRPDVVCTIDYPGMNLKLAAAAKARGIRAVHVVCPQVWAWKRGRIPKIEAALDRLCCFFPFEPALFRPGFAAFVGHPLVEAFSSVRVPPRDHASPLLAILPGSRLGEIEKHMPVLLAAVRLLRRDLPNLKVVIPAVHARAEAAIRGFVADDETLEVIQGGARELLCQADAAVVASGTATLEAALARCPTVLVYRVGWFFALIARLVIKGVRHIGLANIIAEKAGRPCPMPELLQESFTASAVVEVVRPWLSDGASRQQAAEALDQTMALLSGGGDAIGQIVGQVTEGASK